MKACVWWMVLGMLAVVQAGPEEAVAEIRKWYNTIQKQKATSEKKVEFEAEDEPLSGTATIREYGGNMKAVTLSYGAGDHGGADEYHYYRNGALFFVYQIQQYWRFTGVEGADGQSVTVDTRTENRFYFKDGKCVRQLTRSATAKNTEKLAAMVGKLEQKTVTPGEDAELIRKRGGKLAKARTAAEILASFGVK